jgi:spermidine synthase
MRQSRIFFSGAIYATAFLGGAVTLTLEILGTRILAPFYGTTIFVWSSLIGVTMIGLAVGYFAGGWLADKLPQSRILAIVSAVAALSLIVMSLSAQACLRASDVLGPRLGPFAGAMLLFFIPMTLLGSVSPFCVRLRIDDTAKAGSTAGRLFGISTVGSVAGAIVSGIYLIPVIGIGLLIYCCSAVLVLIPLLLLAVNRPFKKASVVSVSIIIAIIVVLALTGGATGEPLSTQSRTRVLMDTQTQYSRVRVMDYANRFRAIFIDGAVQTLYDIARKEFPLEYLALMAKAVDIHGPAENALVIGVGGGGLDALLAKQGIAVTNVEIDPVIADAAKQYFSFAGKIVIDDGRHYLRSTNDRFDLIFVDAFAGFSLSPHLFTKEAFATARSRLKPGGILCVNSAGRIRQAGVSLESDDTLAPMMCATLRSVFAYVEWRGVSRGLTNIVYFASDDPLQGSFGFFEFAIPRSAGLVTDDRNPIEGLVADIIEDWRKEMRESLASVFPF